MANPDSPTTVTPEPSAEDQRYELQGVLGEYHGLLTTIVQELLPDVPYEEMADLLSDIRSAFPEVSISFGEVQGELNTGSHDEGLEGVALNSEQFKPKKRGFRFNRNWFYRVMANHPKRNTDPQRKFNLIRAVKYAMRGVKWGNIIMGSLSKELGKFKGVEVIKEFGEVVVTTLEQIVETAESKATDEAR
jgi:hypothetical protein